MGRASFVWVGLLVHFFAQAAVLCERGPDLAVFDPEISSEKDPCPGSVKIQGFMYKCSAPKNVPNYTSRFFENLKKSAKARCEEYCRKQGAGCTGDFHAPARCGFEVQPKLALEVGRQIAQCPFGCEGKAFSYCSIYHGSYTSMEENMFKTDAPNCFCKKKKAE